MLESFLSSDSAVFSARSLNPLATSSSDFFVPLDLLSTKYSLKGAVSGLNLYGRFATIPIDSALGLFKNSF